MPAGIVSQGAAGTESPSLTEFTPFLIYSINVTIFIEFSFFEFRIFCGSYDVVYQNCYLAAFDFAILTHIHR